ncbi:hypothetical protein D3C87_1165150 [compost metagenome]
MGQRPHFVRHHGKTTPGFTGTSRFDRRVQRQQVGLLGDGTDHVQHLADVASLSRQAFDHQRSVVHVMGHGLDRVDGLHHPVTTLAGGLGRLVRGFGCRHRVARHFFHGGGHFIDGGGGLFDFIVLLLQATGRVLSHCAELFGGGAQLRGGTGDLFDGFAQAGLHRRQGTE